MVRKWVPLVLVKPSCLLPMYKPTQCHLSSDGPSWMVLHMSNPYFFVLRVVWGWCSVGLFRPFPTQGRMQRPPLRLPCLAASSLSLSVSVLSFSCSLSLSFLASSSLGRKILLYVFFCLLEL